jgi:Zn-finger nucleic acid-binding protein
MSCPRDDSALTPAVLGAAQHHICSKCSGRLFSISEFEGLLDHPSEPWKLSSDGQTPEEQDHTVELLCPCGARMELVHLQSSLLHCCRDCKIVWIDPLDLGRLLDKASSLDSFQFRQALQKPVWAGGIQL